MEEFKQGLCAECYPKFKKQSKQWEDEALRRKIKEEERERKREIFSYPGMPVKQWPPEPLRKAFERWIVFRFCIAAGFIVAVILALILIFLIPGC